MSVPVSKGSGGAAAVRGLVLSETVRVEDASERARLPASVRPYDEDRPGRERDLHWIDLLWPYHAHVYLMYLFLEWAVDRLDRFESDRDGFLAECEGEPLLAFLGRVKPGDREMARERASSLVELFVSIRDDGFSLAKRVPVSVNPEGETVMMKGGKRVAACLVLGGERIPAREYPVIESRLAPAKRAVYCHDHTSGIRRQLLDDPGVRSAMRVFDLVCRTNASDRVGVGDSEMSLLELVWPYHGHVVLMQDFLQRRISERRSHPLWRFYSEVKGKTEAAARDAVAALLRVRRDAERRGKGVLRPVPVALNRDGETVMLGGAREAAVAMAMGETRVAVRWVEPAEASLHPRKAGRLCDDHTSAIRERLWDDGRIRGWIRTLEWGARRLMSRAPASPGGAP